MDNTVIEARRIISKELTAILTKSNIGLKDKNSCFEESIGVVRGAELILGQTSRLENVVYRLYNGTYSQSEEAFLYLQNVSNGTVN